MVLVAGFVAAIISGLSLPAQIIVLGRLVDSFNGASDAIEKLNFLCLMYLALACQMFASQFLQISCFSYAASRQVNRLREVYFEALLSQDIVFFDKVNSGVVATSVIESTSIILDGIGEERALSIQQISAFIGSFATAMYYCWQLSLLVLAITPFFLCIFFVAIQKNVIGEKETSQSEISTADNVSPQEIFSGIRTVFVRNSTIF